MGENYQRFIAEPVTEAGIGFANASMGIADLVNPAMQGERNRVRAYLQNYQSAQQNEAVQRRARALAANRSTLPEDAAWWTREVAGMAGQLAPSVAIGGAAAKGIVHGANTAGRARGLLLSEMGARHGGRFPAYRNLAEIVPRQLSGLLGYADEIGLAAREMAGGRQ